MEITEFNEETKLIDNFQKDIFEFINKKRDDLGDGKFEKFEKNYKIKIFEYEAIDNNNLNKKEILRKRSIKISQIIVKNKDSEEVGYIFGSDIYHLHKRVELNLYEIMGKVEKCFFPDFIDFKADDEIEEDEFIEEK